MWSLEAYLTLYKPYMDFLNSSVSPQLGLKPRYFGTPLISQAILGCDPQSYILTAPWLIGTFCGGKTS